MFKKYGDGKIVSVFKEEELTDEQKKNAKELAKQTIKQSDDNTFEVKKSGS